MDRPPDAPKLIPHWAWELLAWHNHGENGQRPPDAPTKVPEWFWHWYAWRNWMNKHKPIPVPSPMRQITMYDSIDLSQIPENADAVAGYVGGRWPTFNALGEGWPHAHRLSVAVFASEDAVCLDVEKGDAIPEQAPPWVGRQLARGVKRPVVYSSLSQMQEVISNLVHSGILRSQFRVWTAHYTGHSHLCSPMCGFGFRDHADATQYYDHALGRNLDVSICAEGFFS